MKKIVYVLILPLVVVSGLVFSFALFANGPGANGEIKNGIAEKSTPKPPSAAESKAALKKWEASPDGIMFKKWKASPTGKKVQAGAAKISKSVADYTDMEAVITSLSLPPGSRLGFGMMVSINGEDYILSFGPLKSYKDNYEFQQLYSLKVNDKIMIRSHNISQAPKYSYPIISGDYVERDGKIMYNRAPQKGGC